jgi:hypothetical protein
MTVATIQRGTVNSRIRKSLYGIPVWFHYVHTPARETMLLQLAHLQVIAVHKNPIAFTTRTHTCKHRF